MQNLSHDFRFIEIVRGGVSVQRAFGFNADLRPQVAKVKAQTEPRIVRLRYRTPTNKCIVLLVPAPMDPALLRAVDNALERRGYAREESCCGAVG